VLELVENEVASDACQKDGALLQYFAASAAAARELMLACGEDADSH